MQGLRNFVNFRESRPEFDLVKKNGGIGFPCFVINDGEKIFIGYNEDTKMRIRNL